MSSDSEEIGAISLGEEESEFSGFEAGVLGTPPTPKLTRSKSKAVISTDGVDKSKKTGRNAVSDQSVKASTSAKVAKTDDKKGKKKSTMKSVVFKPDKSRKESQNAQPFDIAQLSENDILRLKETLGLLPEKEMEYNEPLLRPLNEMPNIHVQVNRDDLSDEEVDLGYYGQQEGHGVDLGAALFDDEDVENAGDPYDTWQPPKLKVPERGPEIAPNLANLINTACTVQCDTDLIVGKYKLPKNCTFLGAPEMNEEVHKCLSPRIRTQDGYMKEVQNLLSVGMVPVIKLADKLKAQIQENAEVKGLMSDILTVIGQTQHMLSLRRRFMIRPFLNRKYANLCNRNTPVSSFLFGDEIGRDIKTCDTGVYLGRSNFVYRGRGRGPRRGRGPYANYGGNSYGGNTFYDQRPAPYPRGRGWQRGQNARFGQRTRRAPSATVTYEGAKN